MSGSGYVSLSLASQLERSLDMSAHNLANANTAGFKAMHPLLQASPQGNGETTVDFVASAGTYLDLTPGAVVPTGNPLDMAISGEGWFGIRMEGDQTGYTRHGKFVMDAEGQIKTANGHSLVDPDGTPLALPLEIGLEVTILQDGSIANTDGEILGQVGVFQVENGDRMTSYGDGIYVPAGEEPPRLLEDGFQIAQGFVEGSNVQAVMEMTRLIDIQRAYENAMSIAGEDHGLTRDAIERLGRSG